MHEVPPSPTHLACFVTFIRKILNISVCICISSLKETVVQQYEMAIVHIAIPGE